MAAVAGYTWTVTAITRGGERTPIPARYEVALAFTPSGQFGASDPVRYHAGTYRQLDDGFTISGLAVSVVGDAGRDPIALLATGAMSALGHGERVATSVSGDWMTISVGGYLIDCRRDGVRLEPELAAAGGKMGRRGRPGSDRMANCAPDDYDHHRSRV